MKYTFGPDGQLTPPIANVTLSNVTVNGTNLGDIQLVHDCGRRHAVRRLQRQPFR